MKRTALRRGSELRRKTPLRSASEPGRNPMQKAQKARRKVQKAKDCRWRSEAYLAWVRQQPCAFCHLGPCDAHHVIGLGWGLSGMGLKAPDSFVMPLCRFHHADLHSGTALQRMQPQWLRWTLHAALADREAGFDAETREALTHALAFVEAKREIKRGVKA